MAVSDVKSQRLRHETLPSGEVLRGCYDLKLKLKHKHNEAVARQRRRRSNVVMGSIVSADLGNPSSTEKEVRVGFLTRLRT